ncbi:MAG: hypothetical protein EYC70_07025 [Planctomycetota bacterium]|nr:MAG: hypothetical protein EYC70_07025 [Planctomycetota bacterium]
MLKGMRARTFSDETTTHSDRSRPRIIRQALVGARCPDSLNLEWLADLHRTRFPGALEPKHQLRDALQADPQLARFVQAKLQASTILIIDLAQYAQERWEELADAFPHLRDYGLDLTSGSWEHNWPPHLQRLFALEVRTRALLDSTPAWIAGMLRSPHPDSLGSHVEADDFLGKAWEMEGLRETREFVARTAAALADARHPETLAAALLEDMRRGRYLQPGLIVVRAVEVALTPDRVFDMGIEPAYEAVVAAHKRIAQRVQELQQSHMHSRLTPGKLSQLDSKHLLGLQAADLCASLAADEYQSQHGSGHERARRLGCQFKRVLYNSEWLV